MNELTTITTRLPRPTQLDPRLWRVLTEQIFPNAKSPHAIEMAVDYCRIRNLDVLKRPVNIVPMWNAAVGAMVETIWPSINEIEITAARTRAWAGMDAPQWGPPIEIELTGRRRRGNSEEQQTQKFRVPEWCAVTVYRLVDGQRYAFTEPVFWLEAYGRAGGGELANDMWRKRPRGQLHKVAKAAALRAAFPEESEYTADEMDGQTLDGAIAPPPVRALEPLPQKEIVAEELLEPRTLALNAEVEHDRRWVDWCRRFTNAIDAAPDADVKQWLDLNKPMIEELKNDAPKTHQWLEAAIERRRGALANAAPPTGKRSAAKQAKATSDDRSSDHTSEPEPEQSAQQPEP